MTAENPLLEDYNAQNPRSWMGLFRAAPRPNAFELAKAALAECLRDQLDHAQQEEFHAAMRIMLTNRERRLRKAVERLATNAPPPADSP